MLSIFSVNLLLTLESWYYIAIAVTWCTAWQFLLDAIIAITINKLPRGWFGVDNPFYRVTDAERDLYKKLKVRRWKGLVWELGGLGGFSKRELREPGSPEYIERFIVECNKGVLTHRLSYPVGFLVMLTLPSPYRLSIALPVALVNSFLNILPTLVLRYNTPMLRSALERQRGKRNKNKENRSF